MSVILPGPWLRQEEALGELEKEPTARVRKLMQ